MRYHIGDPLHRKMMSPFITTNNDHEPTDPVICFYIFGRDSPYKTSTKKFPRYEVDLTLDSAQAWLVFS